MRRSLIVLLMMCALGNPTSAQQAVAPEVKAEGEQLQLVSKQYQMMGTLFRVVLYTADPEKAAKDLEAAFDLAAKVNMVCSDYRADSELSKFNTWPAGKSMKLSPMLWDVMTESARINELTGGVFDPTVGVHTLEWRRSRLKKKLPTNELLEANKKRVGWKLLRRDEGTTSYTKTVAGMRIDFGGIAKGYAADRMFDFLTKEKGYRQVSILAGGDLRIGDAPPGRKGWSVTLKTLDAHGELSPTKVLLKNCAVSTSGDLHQWIDIGGVRYSHIVDTRSGLGMTDRVSATVIAPRAVFADPIATAVCLSPEFAKKLEMRLPDGVCFLRVWMEDQELKSYATKQFPKGISKADSGR